MKWAQLTICDWVLPWCFLANSAASPFPRDEGLGILRCPGSAVLKEDMVQISWVSLLGGNSSSPSSSSLQKESSRLLFLLRGSFVSRFCLVDVIAAELQLECQVGGETGGTYRLAATGRNSISGQETSRWEGFEVAGSLCSPWSLACWA